MKKFLLAVLAAGISCGVMAAELTGKHAVYSIDDNTGALVKVTRKADSKTVVKGFGSRYYLLGNSGDRKASDRADKVVKRYADGNALVFECVNPRLPGFGIVKRYFIVNGGLRREMTFTNKTAEKKFLQVFTDSHFTPEFKENAFYFGAGYIGPYLPAAKVSAPSRVESFVQSSKGMVLINPDGKNGSFAHFRVKLNDTVVFPWCQSTIGSYREKGDRLYYLPDGWRLSLGTLDLEAAKGKFVYTDHFVFFPGDIFDFFEEIYAKDPDFKAAYAKISPEVPEVKDVLCEHGWGFEPYLKYLSKIIEKGIIICKTMICSDWADYRWDDGFNGHSGGYIYANEIQEFIDGMKAVTPRARIGFHTITVSGTEHSPIFKEHPEFFRLYDRAGDKESHFPGLVPNYQTMINRAEVRQYILDSVCSMVEKRKVDFIYQDEAQYQNTINWQTGELIRDDHSIPLWDALRRRVLKEGKFLHFNGSGNPYADVNYMECPHRMLKSEAWREFAGVGLGLEMVSKMRPGSRISLLYMNDLPNYFGRVLANGWITAMGDIARNNCGVLNLMRSAYEVSKTLPQRVAYAPDWKRDKKVNWESYSVRRLDSGDIIVSFINRTGKNSDLNFEMDLDIPAYPAGTPLNVWAYRTRYPHGAALKYILSDKEIRDVYAQYRWFSLSSAVPELIYSGENSGKLAHVFKNIGKDELVQYVISPAPAAVYSVNGQPGTYLFTKRRGIEISGNEIVSTLPAAEILLGDKDAVFTDVCLNGKPVAVEQIDINGLLMQKITVPAGTHRLSYQRSARGAVESTPLQIERKGRQITVKNDHGGLYVVEKDGFTCLTGKAPLMLPEHFLDGMYRVRRAGTVAGGVDLPLAGGKNSSVAHQPYPRIPAKTVWQDVNKSKDGVKILRAGTYLSAHSELRNLQQNLAPAVAEVDPETLTITAGTTRRDDVLDINHFGGFELSGAECVQLKLTHNFLQAQSFFEAGSHVWLGGEKSKIDFSGVVVDYRVNGKYTKRAIFSWGIGTRYLECRYPEWGTAKKQDVYIRLDNFLEKPETVFSLDLKKYAPSDWDGTVILAAGNNHILANRMLNLQILKFNDRNTGDFAIGKNVGDVKKAGFIPEPLHLPKVKNVPSVNVSETSLGKWAKLSALQPYGATEELTQKTSGFLSYDDKALYVMIFAHEKARAVRTPSKLAWQNDCVDIFFETTDKNIIQLTVDGKGRAVATPEGSFHGAKVEFRLLASGGYVVLAKIPWQDLGIKEVAPGMAIKANFCRSRAGKGGDRATWGPARSESGLGFRDLEKYGTVIPGFPVSGMGRFDEVEI